MENKNIKHFLTTIIFFVMLFATVYSALADSTFTLENSTATGLSDLALSNTKTGRLLMFGKHATNTCDWNYLDSNTHGKVANLTFQGTEIPQPNCVAGAQYNWNVGNDDYFLYFGGYFHANITTWDSDDFSFVQNDFGYGATCDLTEKGVILVGTGGYIVAVDTDANSLYACKLSPRTALGWTTNGIEIDGYSSTLGYTNRFMLMNQTHFISITFNENMNLSSMVSCDIDFTSQISYSDINGLFGYNGWLFVYGGPSDRDVYVYDGLGCNFEEHVTLSTLGCSPSNPSGLNGMVIDEGGIHCTDSTLSSRLLRYDGEWEINYFLNDPTSAVGTDTDCESPCIFNDQFSYTNSPCNHGWLALSPTYEHCSRAVTNGSHLSCEDNVFFGIRRTFDTLDYTAGKVYIEFEYTPRDDSRSLLYTRSPAGLYQAVVLFDGLNEEIFLNYRVPDGGPFDMPINETNNYMLEIDMVNKEYSLGVEINDSFFFRYFSPFFDIGSTTMNELRIQYLPAEHTCNWEYDYINMTLLFTEEEINETPVYWNQTLNLTGVTQEDLFFDDSISLRFGQSGVDWTKCRPNENHNVCFGRLAVGGITDSIKDLILGNIVAVLSIAIIIALIGWISSR